MNGDFVPVADAEPGAPIRQCGEGAERSPPPCKGRGQVYYPGKVLQF